jgi:hypothetical protein
MSEQNQHEASLRELALRLLSPRYPGAEFMQVTDLLPGQLPPHPPVELPLPSEAWLIGSVLRGQDSTTLFETALTPEQLLAFYRERMTALGWTEQEQFFPSLGGGFLQAAPAQAAHALFFATAHGPSLRLASASLGVAKATEAQLTIETAPHHLGQGPLRRHPNQDLNVIPPLLAPEGARQQGMGGGGGGGDWRASAELTTDLDLAAVTEQYTMQLAAAGWKGSSHGEGDHVRWSFWDFADTEGEPWRGYLFVFQPPDDPQRYFLELRAKWAGPGGGDGGRGWAGYAPLT